MMPAITRDVQNRLLKQEAIMIWQYASQLETRERVGERLTNRRLDLSGSGVDETEIRPMRDSDP